MSKMTRAEKDRAAARRRRAEKTNFQMNLADGLGIGIGAGISGFFGLTERKLGPIPVAGLIGLSGLAAKMMLPAADRNPLLSGATTAMVAIGGTQTFVAGATVRAARGLPGSPGEAIGGLGR